MYTVQENVRIVVAYLKHYNIRKVVISPGSTNVPLVQALQEDSFFTCYSVVDERSAIYFAIGLHMSSGEIIATSCTSAQATRNYVPGLTEAFYKHVPILAITTAKLERFQYQEYMQAPVQCSLPEDAVKASYDLSPVTDQHTRVQCTQMVREAILETTHGNPGPVQLNLRMLDEYSWTMGDEALPQVRPLRRYMAWEDWNDLDLQDKRILIVVGEHRPFGNKEYQALEDFCKAWDAAVYVNHLSNFRGAYSVPANLYVAANELKGVSPDILITIGGQTGDYPVYGALTRHPDIEHWRVSEDGKVVDTYGKLTRIFECPPAYFFSRLLPETPRALFSRMLRGGASCQHAYYDCWKRANERMEYELELPFSNLYAAQQMRDMIPEKSIVHFAILNSLRCWSYFPPKPSVQYYSNVAAFGIDGCTSMLLGESMNTDELCFIVTGDLAFFYDMNALGMRHLRNNIRILLINNGGGVEFALTKHCIASEIEIGAHIAAHGHYGSARGWAESCNFRYMSASNKEDFLKLREDFIAKGDKPVLWEIFTKDDDEVGAITALLNANRIA